MKKRIQKHIDNQDFVKVYIEDKGGIPLTHFGGIIFDQSESLLLIGSFYDFTYDGFVIVRKRDVFEIKNTDSERFFKHILEKEGIFRDVIKKREQLKIQLSSLREAVAYLQKIGTPVIIEGKYSKDERFIIGPILEKNDKKVKIRYFNTLGEFDLKPVSIRFKDVTTIQFDSPYANIFYKYATEIK
jgi:hypothetical protein